jgi:hypothetical protein
MKISTYIKLATAITVIILLLAGFFWLRDLTKDDHISLGSDTQIDVTPTQIMSIKAIGEWEFLAVNAEELVDTVRKGFFSDDELVRIYYGTLRLGIDMSQLEPEWIEASGDSVMLMLPKVGLLDTDFIDEARTKPFFESGKWKPEDKEAMYKKAYRQMKAHCLTKENLQAAEANGEEQMRNMMRSMGYKNIKITWKN